MSVDEMDLQAALRHYAAIYDSADWEITDPERTAQLMRDAADCIDELEQRR